MSRFSSWLRRNAEQHLGRRLPQLFGSGRQRHLLDEYEVRDLITRAGRIPLLWWTIDENFGDLLSPWLFRELTGTDVALVERGDPEPHYVAVGSILNRVTDQSIVWGTGSFGTEGVKHANANATYAAVRGPLTRSRIRQHGGDCPEVYGDPALLTPSLYQPRITPEYEYGVIVRWSERDWAEAEAGPGVLLIDYRTADIEGTIDQMLACRNIITSSLHGLILADAYGIPNAWIASDTPKGREYKFHDYFASVRKHRYPHNFEPHHQTLTAPVLREAFTLSPEPITFDHRALLDACPFLARRTARR